MVGGGGGWRWRVVGGVGGVGGGAVVVRGSEGGVAACVFGYITAISFVHFLEFVKTYTKKKTLGCIKVKSWNP